jgi:signal transduction histidine kinase
MGYLASIDRLGRSRLGSVLLTAATLVAFAATFWCHLVLGIELVYTHILYLPVCLAGLWWGRRGIWVAALLGGGLVAAHAISPLPDPLPNDGFRALMLLVVGWLVGSLSDHHREAEQQLRELNLTKDKFFSIISHDLRSPFQNLLLLSEELWKGINGMPPERIRDYARGINSSSKRLLGLAEDLLEWSRIETGAIHRAPETTDISTLAADIGEIYQEYATRKGVRLEVAIPTPVTVWADPRHVRCILRNLISNAIKFTPREGLVRVTAFDGNSTVTLLVADTGVGIPPEALDVIFRIDIPHTTRGTDHEHGSGLGLILTRELAEMNGGTLTIESEPGAGTTVTVSVPRR